jgi:hypothetical protein
MALATGPAERAFIRVAYDEQGVVYIDLADRDWRAVRIDARGWSVIASPPVRFVRTPFLAPLPEPQPGGSLEFLRPFVNVSDEEWPLYVACLLGFLRPDRTYPLLVVNGPQGSGKTVLTKQTKLLIDPSSVEPHTGVPSGADDPPNTPQPTSELPRPRLEHEPGMTVLKTLFPYLGGKARQARWIASHIDSTPYTAYVETCCGSAAVFFAKKPCKIEILNDKDPRFQLLFKAIRNNLDEVVDYCSRIEYSKSAFDESYYHLRGNPDRLPEWKLGCWALFQVVAK